MKFHLLEQMAEHIRRLEYLTVFDASTYEQYNGHVKRPSQRSSRRSTTTMQGTVLLIERQRSGE